jgi:hypothetical protein
MTKLTQFRLDSLKTEGLYSDPETTGLYVQVTNRRGKREGITIATSVQSIRRVVAWVWARAR